LKRNQLATGIGAEIEIKEIKRKSKENQMGTERGKWGTVNGGICSAGMKKKMGQSI
jgi:hypothetical protein